MDENNDQVVDKEILDEEAVLKARETFYLLVKGLVPADTIKKAEGSALLSVLMQDSLALTLGEPQIHNPASLNVAITLLQQGFFMGLFFAQNQEADILSTPSSQTKH